MSLEQAIHENTAAIRDLIAAISKGVAVTPAQVQAAVQEAAPDTKPAKKSTSATPDSSGAGKAGADTAPPATTTSETAAPAAADDTPAAADITLADITTVVLDLGKAGKRAALVSLLAEYGVPKASALDPSKFAEFHTKASALLGG